MDEGIDFQELNAHLVNCRTNESIAHCKAYMCRADCKLEDFDAYEDLAAIASRLLQVASPKQEDPEAYACCVLLFVVMQNDSAAGP